MVNKTRADYVRHYFLNYDKNLEFSKSHILSHVDLSSDLCFHASYNQQVSPGIYETVYGPIFRMYDDNGGKIKNWTYINLHHDDEYWRGTDIGVYPTSEVFVAKEIGVDEETGIPNNFALSPVHCNIEIPENYPVDLPYFKPIGICMKYLKDVYDYDKINGVITFRGQRLNKDVFWNEFKDYIVPVYQSNDSTASHGDMLQCFKDIDSSVGYFLCLYPFHSVDTGESPEYFANPGSNIIYNNVIIESVLTNREGYYFNARRFGDNTQKNLINGIGIQPQLPCGMFGLNNYPPNTFYNPIAIYTSNNEFIVISNYDYSVNSNRDIVDFTGIILYRYFDDETFEQYKNSFPSNINMYCIERFLGLNSGPSNSFSDSNDNTLKYYYMTDISYYYEDIHQLDRSFEFEYDGMEHNPCITAYNQAELEHYLKTWRIPFIYDNDWITPLPEPILEGQKVRHILLGSGSDVVSEKVRHKILMSNSDIPSTKIRHIIGGV